MQAWPTTDDDYLVNWWLRYGLPQPHLKGRRCADSCRQFGLGSVALAPVFTSGVHSISCDSCDNAGWRLHQALVTECERFCCEELGGSASRSGIACHADDDGMVDTMITQPSRFCGTGGVDVTVVNVVDGGAAASSPQAAATSATTHANAARWRAASRPSPPPRPSPSSS